MANPLQRLVAQTLGMVTKDDLTAVVEALTVDDLREPGWRLVGDPDGTGAWADPTQIKEVQREAQNWWLKDPLLGQAVNLKRFFVLGPGVSFTAEDPECEAALRSFWDDPGNRLFFARGEWFDSLAVYAELALRFFTVPDGSTQVRLIPVTEIADVVTDPEDRHQLLYLRRQWTRRTFDAAGKSYRDEAVDELIPGEEVLFVAVNHPPGWVRGISPLYRAIPWAKAYTEWLQDRARLNKAKGAWAWLRRIKGGAAALAKSSQELASKIGGAVRGSTGTAELPPPKVGSVITTNEGVEWEILSNRIGADDAKEDGRALKLQVAASLNIFEHYFGDASVANLASAKAMELPMRREYEWWQGLLAWIIRQIFRRVLDAQVRAGRLPESFTVTKKVWRDGVIVEDTTEKQTVDCFVDVNFPPLKGEDNRLDQVKAAQVEQQMGVKSDATLASELGVEDWAQEQARLEMERQARQAKSREEMTQQFPPFPGQTSNETYSEAMRPGDWKKAYKAGVPHWAEDLQPSMLAQQFVQKIQEAGKKKGEVLEIGCGNGRDSILFAKAGHTVTSVDVAPGALDLARTNAKQAKVQVDFLEANAEKLPLGDARFDGVFSLSVLHATNLEKSITEVARVLKVGGLGAIHIYSNTQTVDGREEIHTTTDGFIKILKTSGFELLDFYSESEDEFDEAGEKHGILVAWVRKEG